MILIGLGANLEGPFGPPEAALQACGNAFKHVHVKMVKGSHIWKTAPVPLSDQPLYKNAVCTIETDLSPVSLLQVIKQVEIDFGRVSAERNASRVIDLDILAYHDVILDGNLMIPHPRLQDRAFVLYPLREVAPEWRHPVLGKSVDEMIEELPKGQICEQIKGMMLL